MRDTRRLTTKFDRRIEQAHEFHPTTNGPTWHAAGYDLGHCGQIRNHPIACLPPTRTPAEPGDHFVKNQHGFMHVGKAPQFWQKPVRQWHAAVVRSRHLADDRADIVVTLQRFLKFCQIRLHDDRTIDGAR